MWEPLIQDWMYYELANLGLSILRTRSRRHPYLHPGPLSCSCADLPEIERRVVGALPWLVYVSF